MCDDSVYNKDLQCNNIRYTSSMIDVLYNNIPGFILTCIFGNEVELIDANSQFCQYMGIEEGFNRRLISNGENMLIDELYKHADEIKKRRDTVFTCSIIQAEGRRDFFLVKVMQLEHYNSTYLVMCVDISDQRRLQEQLETERERYQVALECSKDILFEYNTSSDILITYGVFGNDEIPKNTVIQIPNYRTRLISGERVHADDIDMILKALESGDFSHIEVRLVGGTKKHREYRWALVEGRSYSNADGVQKIIGKMTDIQSRKMEELKRMETLYVDQLTGIYNNDRMEYLVEQYSIFRKDNKYAIMVLDIVNYDNINSTYGLHFGDILLKDIAEVLKKRVRNVDVLARIGGDEFMLLVKESDKLDLVKYAQTITKQMLPDYFGNISDEKITFSVGIAEVDDNESWKTVIDHAKQTVMYVKMNRIEPIVKYTSIVDDIKDKDLKLEFVSSDFFKKDMKISDDAGGMLSFSLDLLERVKDTRKAMYMLLIRMSKVFRLSQIDIYETDFNSLISTCIYRVKKKPYPEEFCLKHKSVENIERAYSKADSDGFIYLTKDDYIKAAQGYGANIETGKAQEILISVIKNEGKPRGFIAFHSGTTDRFSDEMRIRIKEVAKIIGTHINKASSDSASRMKSEFLSRMSHEIRTPMNAIIGMTDIAMSCLSDTDRVKDSLTKIGISTKYLLSIVNDILNMSRIETGKIKLNIEQFSMTKLIEDIEMLMRPQAEKKGIKFNILKNFTDDTVYGDDIKLTQVLVNIVGNAVKFTNSGGKILMRIEQMQSEDDVIVYRFLIKDTGIGIDNKKFTHIFNAFEQADEDTSEKFGGTGLGLAISNNIIHLMGSRIEVKSQLGKGSEFYFTLPLKRINDSSVKDEIEEKDDTAYNFSGKRILIAEDNQLNAEIAETILGMVGFETEIAGNGAVALKRFSEEPTGYYDVILMDIRMPVMDGIIATQKIRGLDKEDAKSIPIIAMTANAFDDDMKETMNNGMNAHLSKPIDTKKLYRTLKENLPDERKT